MKKDEFYCSILLLTILLISVVWNSEVEYRTSLVDPKTEIPKRVADSLYIYDEWLGLNQQSKDLKETFVSKKKRDKSWMEAYKSGIVFNYGPKWNP